LIVLKHNRKSVDESSLYYIGQKESDKKKDTVEFT